MLAMVLESEEILVCGVLFSSGQGCVWFCLWDIPTMSGATLLPGFQPAGSIFI